MALQLGLRDLVNIEEPNKSFAVPPRMLPPPIDDIEREERVRAYWMVETLDGYSTWNQFIARPPVTKSHSSNAHTWQRTDPSINRSVFGDSEPPSSFALYVSFVTNEIYEVRHFLQQSLQTTTPQECETWDREFRRVEGYLKNWRARHLSLAGSPASDITSPPRRPPHFDPTLLLADTAYNMYSPTPPFYPNLRPHIPTD